MHEYQQPDQKEAKQFLSKIWEGREYKRNAGWIKKKHGKLFQGLKEGSQVKYTSMHS